MNVLHALLVRVVAGRQIDALQDALIVAEARAERVIDTAALFLTADLRDGVDHGEG